MPWKVESAGENKYYVVNQETGQRMSRRPLSKARAGAQLRALYANVPEAREKEYVEAYTTTLKRIGRRPDLSRAGRSAGLRKYGNVTFADPVNHKYPIDTPGHIRAAWSYIHMPKNAGFYSDKGGVEGVQNAIRAAYTREFGHPPGAKNIRPRRKKETETATEKAKSIIVRIRHGKRDRRGNIEGLAKHLSHQLGGDPGMFRKVFNSGEIAGYPDEVKKAIAARVHKIVTGIWPGEHRGKNPNGPEKKKEATPTIRNMLEGKIHSSFTETADQLFQRGYIDRDTRIALSGLIGDVLSEFGERFETTGLDAPLSEEDAKEISNKEVSATPTGVPGHGPGGVFSTPGLGTAIPAPKKKKKGPILKANATWTAITTKELKQGILTALKGSAGSGNYGHAGRPGVTGGSAPRMGSGAAMSWITGRYTEQNRQFNKLASRAAHFSDMSPDEINKFADEARQAFAGTDRQSKQSRKAIEAISQGYVDYRNNLSQGVIAHMQKFDDALARPEKVLEGLVSNLDDHFNLPYSGKISGGQGRPKYNPYESHVLDVDVPPVRSDYPAGEKLFGENVSENLDYKPARVRKVNGGGYEVRLNSGAFATGSSRAEAVKKAQATQYRRDVSGLLHNGKVPKVEALIDAGYGDDWNRVKKSGYYPAEIVPVVSDMLKKYRRASRKEITTLRQTRSQLFQDQQREYSRLKSGDTDAMDRLRELRLEGREIEKDLRRSCRVSVKEYLDDEDLQ